MQQEPTGMPGFKTKTVWTLKASFLEFAVLKGTNKTAVGRKDKHIWKIEK